MACSTAGLGATRQEEVQALNTKLEQDLRARNPEAAELFVRAVEAQEKEDHRKAADLYARLHEMVPDFTPALRRQGHEELTLGNRDRAVELCREAEAKEPSATNHAALALALVGSPNADERREAMDLASRATEQEPDSSFAQTALAEAAMANDNVLRLERAAYKLVHLLPQDNSGFFYLAVAQASKGDFDSAEANAALARERGLDPETYQSLMDGIDGARPWYVRLLAPAAWVVSLWLGALLVLFVSGGFLSRAALKAAERMPAQPTGEAQGLDASLRRLYRGVLWASCLFYWLSIPLVVLSVIGVAGGLLYAIFAMGHIPIKLVLLIVVVAGASLIAIVKSLFARGRDVDPGLKMSPSEEPRLDAILTEVAGRVGTRKVDNVYLTPGTELAVMERGGMMKQMGGTPERCLILGVGVLEGMKLGPFKAILAHEYGHFSNRDTAGGGFALAVRRSLLTMAQHLAEGGAAAWYNPAWLFVNGFHRVFLRISQGASRLQEVLADRWAAFTYGGRAFERGLRHVIERSIRFDAFATATLNEVIQKKQPLANLYAYQPSALMSDNDISYQIEEAFNSEPSPYDSHPRPADRIRWVQAIPGAQTSSIDDERDAWTLFRDREALEKKLTVQVRLNVHANTDIMIPGEAQAAG